MKDTDNILERIEKQRRKEKREQMYGLFHQQSSVPEDDVKNNKDTNDAQTE
jgi:hypothetical protein